MRPLPFSGVWAYAAIFWSVYTTWFVAETIGTFVTRHGRAPGASDRGSFKLIYLMMYLGLALDFGLSFALPRAAIRWERTPVFFAGIALMLAGLAFRFYAMWVLGRFFTYSVAIHTGQTVVESGPYRYIRHPSYTGALMTLVGVGLALGNWAGLFALLACTGVAYAYRMRVEESALAEALGEPYRDYMRRTQRLIPFVY